MQARRQHSSPSTLSSSHASAGGAGGFFIRCATVAHREFRRYALLMKLKSQGRYDYVPLRGPAIADWQSISHFSFRAASVRNWRPAAAADILNYAWRDCGNRFGAPTCWPRRLQLSPGLVHGCPAGLVPLPRRPANSLGGADIVIDQFDEMLELSQTRPPATGVALHADIVGQLHRLRHLKRALRRRAAHRESIWLTTSGAVARHRLSLPAGIVP